MRDEELGTGLSSAEPDVQYGSQDGDSTQKGNRGADRLTEAVGAARQGDEEARRNLESYGIDWRKRPVVRFVNKAEVDAIMGGGRYDGRFGDGRVDVTDRVEGSTGASMDYRVTFKDDLDWTLSDRLVEKNRELGDGWIKDGYSLDDVARIEKRKADGSWEVVYEGNAGEGRNFLNLIRDLFSKGKEYASRLYKRSYFDVAKTPDFMKELGLTGDKFTIRFGVVSRHIGKDPGHNLPESVWTQLPESIKNPFAITRYFSDSDKKIQKGYRLYTTLRLPDGSFVVVSAEVKNAGKEIEVNSINTVFGRNALSAVHDELIYKSKNITPEQQALLDGNDLHQYPAEREQNSSTGKDSESSASVQENGEKNGGETVEERVVRIEVGDDAIGNAVGETGHAQIAPDTAITTSGWASEREHRVEEPMEEYNSGYTEREDTRL